MIIVDNTRIESNCFIEKWTQIGDDCKIHFGSVLGSAPQDSKYKGEKSWVVIGDRNEIREYVTINRATGKDATTKIGNDNILLTNVHLAHNCQLGNNITIVNMANIAGHSSIGDRAIIGGMTGIHQFCRIGEGAMVGAYTRLPQDVPPFMLCEGNPAIIRGLNVVGLRRNGATRADMSELKSIYKALYRSEMNTSQAMEHIASMNPDSPMAKRLVDFIQADSPRGITKNNTKLSDEEE